MPRRSALDKIFGGKPGAADETRAAMRRTYGVKDGDHVFFARIAKSKHRAKKPRPR
jgi:hypothetical protein